MCLPSFDCETVNGAVRRWKVPVSVSPWGMVIPVRCDAEDGGGRAGMSKQHGWMWIARCDIEDSWIRFWSLVQEV